MNSKKAVVLLGAGPGLGSALAEAFALAGHPVAIGARTQSKIDKIANEINEKIDNGNQNVKAFSVDATDTNSVRQFVKQASKAWSPDTFLHVGIWNPNAGFGARPFNQWTETQMQEAFKVQVLAAHVFSNQFLEEVGQIKGHSGHRATLLFTGASAAWKGSEGFAGFSAAKAGLRMMIESLAREKGKELIHVCHIVIDGLLDTSAVSSQLGEAPYQNSRINVNDLAKQYLLIHQQPPSVWTNEISFRPYKEKW